MFNEHYHKIGDLARMFGLTVRTLRYYEELGLLESERRSESGHRHYPEKNLVYLKRIQQLKDYGLSLSEIGELFELARGDRSGRAVRLSLKQKYLAMLTKARERQRQLELYIEDLSWHVEQLERVVDFFDCPGKACQTCAYADRCDLRLEHRQDKATAPGRAKSPGAKAK